MVETFVTTMDNPYDYWTEFDEWYAFDTSHGYDVIGEPYNTLNYVARVADEMFGLDSSMSKNEYTEAVNNAVDEILKQNLTGNYRKTVKKAS